MLEELVQVTLSTRTPFAASALYLLYTISLNKKFRGSVPAPRALYSGLTALMVIHNLVMSGFSFVVFKNSFFILVDFYKEYGFWNFLSDPDKVLFQRLEFYTWVFYVSKYVEILDTVIIHLNTRRTTFLQMYHHAGAIICCWLHCIARTHVTWIFVVFNSFVHTFMYFYYCLSSLKIRTKLKKTITYLQIAQFVAGSVLFCLFLLLGDIFSPEPVLRSVQYATAILNLVYVGGLFFLFKNFARKTYAPKEKPE